MEEETKTIEKPNETKEKKKYKVDMERLAHIIINFFIYFAVFFIKDENSTILIILTIIPALLAINSFIYGFKTRGCDSIYSMFSALVFTPFIYFRLDETYWIYLLMYLSFMIIANVIGSFLSNFRKRPEGCTDVGCNCKWKLLDLKFVKNT